MIKGIIELLGDNRNHGCDNWEFYVGNVAEKERLYFVSGNKLIQDKLEYVY